MAKFDPIKNAVILDIETAGTAAGSPIHEIALYQMDTKRGYQFLMEPNFVVKSSNVLGTDNKRLTTGSKDRLIDFFDVKFYSDVTESETTLRQVASHLAGPDNKGYKINWGDTLIARSIYLDEISKAGKSDFGGGDEIAAKAAKRMEEIFRFGGTGELLKASQQATQDGTKRLNRKEIFNLIKKTDSFLYNAVIKPLDDGDAAVSRSIYPYLTKIFSQAESNEEAVDMIRKSGLANISLLAKAKDVSMKALITNEPIQANVFIGNAFNKTPGLSNSFAETVKFGDIMADRAIWIANANFESKQFGAQVAALESDLYSQLKERKIKKSEYFERLRVGINEKEYSFLRGYATGGTSPYTADVFTISNPLISKKRAHAMLRGFGWTDVFKTYRSSMQAGDVGDIFDIVRAHQEYLTAFSGRRNISQKPLTLSMDISYRLYKAAEVMAETGGDETLTGPNRDKILRALFEAESHIGLEDASKTEAFVLRKSFALSSFYQDLLDDPGSSMKIDYKTPGTIGREAMMFQRLYNRIIPEIQESQLEKRTISAFIDFFEQGETEQTTGRRRILKIDRLRQTLADDGTISGFETTRNEISLTSKVAGANEATAGKRAFKFSGKRADITALLKFLETAEQRGRSTDYSPIVELMKKRHPSLVQKGATRDQLVEAFFKSIVQRMTKSGGLEKLDDGTFKINIVKLRQYEDKVRHSTDERIKRSLNLKENVSDIQEQIRLANEKQVDLTTRAATDPQANVSKPSQPKVIPQPNLDAGQSAAKNVAPQNASVASTMKSSVSAAIDEIDKAFSHTTALEFERIIKEAPERIRGFHLNRAESVAMEKSVDLSRRLMAKTKAGLGFMAGVGAVGLIANQVFDRGLQQRNGPDTLRTMNYQKWLQTQQQFFGNSDPNTMEGMSHNGISSILRRFNTDFGSPYKGMELSSYVFDHQNLLLERERYMRQSFGERHYTDEGDIGRLFQKIRLGTLINTINSNASIRDNYNLGGGETGQYDLAGIKKGSNLTKINLKDYRITVEDADTIVLNRRGANNNLTGFFGMNEAPLKIRLGGIDAPETAHGNRSAQPFAYEAKSSLQAMINASQNLELYVDQSNVTYGRQIGFLFGDRGQNINLELIRKGQASFLPFRGKGMQQAYDEKIFGSASKLAQGNNYGMWGSPYFQAYRDVVKSSGQSITFNTLANVDKAAQNSNIMSVYSLANTAESLGFYNSQMQIEASQIGQRLSEFGASKDKFQPIFRTGGTAPHKSYMLEMLTDLGNMIRNKGGRIDNKLNTRDVMKLNKSLAIDSTGTTTNIYNKRRMNATSMYKYRKTKRAMRRNNMAMGQKNALRAMSESPIGHYKF